MTVSRQAIVTGAAGFIGSHMVDLLLNEGYYVRALDNLSVGRIENLSHCINDSRLDFEQIDLKCLDPNSPLFSNVEYVFHFAGSDPKGQGSERTVGACVAVAAHDGHSGEGESHLRADYVHDPLARVTHREKAHTELGAIRPQGLHLGATHRVGDLEANVGGGDVVILGGHRQVRSTHQASGYP